MKITLVLLFAFSMSLAFSQAINLQDKPKKESRFSFGWVYSPEAAFRVLSQGDDADVFTELSIDLREDLEKVKFGQSFSVFAGYQLSNTFSLEAGIGYTDFGEGESAIDLYSWIDPTVLYATIKGTNHLHVASIPVTAHINLGGKRVKGFVSAGIAPGVLMRYTTTSYYDYADGSKSTDNDYSVILQDSYSKFILGAHISGGIDYQYTNKASLRIAPIFRMTTNSVYSGDDIRGHYFNAGIEIGTVYKL